MVPSEQNRYQLIIIKPQVKSLSLTGPYPPVRLVGIYLTTFWSTNHWRRAHNTLAGYVWTI